MLTAEPLELTEPPHRYYPLRRRRRDPEPHFKVESALQFDPVRGCPDAMVPEDHLARTVWEMVGLLDTAAPEARYSSLGRRGHHPRRLLAVWVYASLIGMHSASKVARALKTDLAFLLLSGGNAVSASTLCTFRRKNGELFARALEQTLKIAIERKLVNPEQLAVDSVRIQAEASLKSVRTLKRSEKRLKELHAVDVSTLDEGQREAHETKVRKHADAVEHCQREKCPSYSTTNDAAGLMKFPNGAALPGHRVNVTSSGSDVRFVVAAVVNSAGNDYGQTEEAVRGAHRNLLAAGMPEGTSIQVAADPGYLSEADLQFAAANRSWVDVLIHEPPAPRRGKKVTPGGFFGRADFQIHDDGSATCPAGRKMRGPYANGEGRLWRGDGCGECALKSRCTTARERVLTQRPETDRVHDAMRKRMAKPGAKERYNRRIATIEPVFSYIEDAMGFRRVSSRFRETVHAELLLKLLSYNLIRLATARSLVVCVFTGVWRAGRIRMLAAWVPRRTEISELWSFDPATHPCAA